jgi:hypothetical protein
MLNIFSYLYIQCIYITGVLILNLVCRDETIKENVLKLIRKVFDQVYIKNIEEEVNQIVYAIKRTEPCDIESDSESRTLASSDSVVSSDIANYLASCVKSSSVDLSDQFKNMTVIER